jgi:SAM-dependent methyltransferase
MPSDVYHYLANYYDHLFEFRRPFDKARKAVIDPILPGVSSACDLCCGTGGTAMRFAGQGIATFAVDLSPYMCRITQRKCREAGLRVRVIQADMREFRLPQAVELITCEFDALNHVPRKSDLSKVARSAAAALRPGGYLVFDVNNRLAFERVWSGTWFLEKDPVVMVMHGGHKPGSDRAWTDVEWFIRKGKSYQRRHEHVEEVCWSEEDIRSAFRRSGFDEMVQWDAAPFFSDALTQPGNRTFWRMRKSPGK